MNLSNSCYSLNFPNSQIISFDGKLRVTWKDLKQRVNNNIAFIQKQDISHWVLFNSSPVEFLASALALAVCGQTVIVPANIQSETLKLIESEFEDVGKICLYPDEINFNSSIDDDLELKLDSKFVLFTSGSSGQPKAIIKTLNNLLLEIEELEKLWGQGVDTIVSTVSHQHLYGLLFSLLWPFITGKSFKNKQLKYPEELYGFSERTALVTSPAILSRLDATVEYHKFDLVFSSGGPLLFDDSNKAMELLSKRPTEVYGSTETGGIGYRQQEVVQAKWKLLPKVQLFQRDNDFFIKSPFVFQDSLKLDDELVLHDEKYFSLKGRKDRVVKFEEKRLSLTQMEQYLEKTVWVEVARCILLEQKRTILATVIVLSKDGWDYLEKNGKRQLVKLLKKELLHLFELVVLPKKWRFIDSIPTNTMSKVKIAQLEELFK